MTPASPAAPEHVPGYGDRSPNWTALGMIGAAHVAAIAALLTTGAIRLGEAPAAPVKVAFVEEIAEPLVAEPAPAATLETVSADIFLPEIVVETPVAPPSPVKVTDVLPPPAAVAAPIATKGSGDSPIVPPDFTADQLNNPGPRYPSASRRAHEEGTVMLKVLVSPEGRAQELGVATSSGYARLDAAALATVKRWAFLPAKKAGIAVAAWVLVPVTFALGDG